jgi:hypothetical protein
LNEKVEDAILSANVMKNLPPLAGVRRLKYDEICVHFSFNIEMNRGMNHKRRLPVVWSWYVLAGNKEPNGDWKFWGLADKECPDFEEFTLGELRGIAKSWNAELTLDAEIQFTLLSRVMEKLGLRWYDSDE